MVEQLDKAADGANESQYRVEDYFCSEDLLDDIVFIFKEVDKPAHGADKQLQDLRAVFGQNILAAFFTASTLPVFARRTAFETGYMTMFGITLTTKLSFNRATVEESIKKAHESMRKTINETEWGKNLEEMAAVTARGYLAKFISDKPGREAIGQIMNQCAVLVWSSLEILASDLFVCLLNRKPSLASPLLNAESTKKYYREKELAASLAEYNYDLSRHMGEALVQQRRLDDLMAIKNVYGVLMDKSETLQKTLSEADLWRLYKTRNLIVHRAGMVDVLFQKETGNVTPLGMKLRVTPSELKTFMILVGRAGGELVEAATRLIQDRP
jgi:hypothetical protein